MHQRACVYALPGARTGRPTPNGTPTQASVVAGMGCVGEGCLLKSVVAGVAPVAINGQHGALTQVVTAVLVHKAADKVRFIFAEICHGLFRTDPYEL